MALNATTLAHCDAVKEGGNHSISNDPKFEEKVTDIVGLYLDPPDRAVVLLRLKLEVRHRQPEGHRMSLWKNTTST